MAPKNNGNNNNGNNNPLLCMPRASWRASNSIERVRSRLETYWMSKQIAWIGKAWEEYIYWPTQDRKTLKRINNLIKDVKRDSFAGIGKPEPLRESLSGIWSRRIDEIKNHL